MLIKSVHVSALISIMISNADRYWTVLIQGVLYDADLQ